jgi:4-amino-4-deoxy-L-arabinose transferase-like glycosyltransferase
LAAIAASAMAWAVLLLSVPAKEQDFPLGDDWAFSHSFLDWAAGQGLNYRQFAAMPQLGQWLWALPFHVLFSPPQFALRLSTIVLGWLALIAFYDLLRQDGCPPSRAGFLTAVLALNALWLQLQATFMTDVPALAFSLVALACYGRAIDLKRPSWLVPAVAAALLAAITRQNTIVVPLVALYFAWKRDRYVLRSWLIVGSFLLPLAAAIATHSWFVRRPDVLTFNFGLRLTDTSLVSPFLILHTCGLMSLPAIALCPRPRSIRLLIVNTALMLGMGIYWAYHRIAIPSFDKAPYYPYTMPILSPVGPFAWGLQVGLGPTLLSVPVRQILSVAGCIGGAYLLTAVVELVRDHHRAGLVPLYTCLQLVLLLVTPTLYDRYLLVLLPGALWLMSRQAGSAGRVQSRPLLALGMLLALGVFSVCLTHDWLNWNRARWQLGGRALSQGISPWDIEGGFEWDGWYAPAHRSFEDASPQAHVLHYTQAHFKNVRGRFALGFSRFMLSDWVKIPTSVRVRDHEDFTLWTSPGRSRIFLLEID